MKAKPRKWFLVLCSSVSCRVGLQSRVSTFAELDCLAATCTPRTQLAEAKTEVQAEKVRGGVADMFYRDASALPRCLGSAGPSPPSRSRSRDGRRISPKDGHQPPLFMHSLAVIQQQQRTLSHQSQASSLCASQRPTPPLLPLSGPREPNSSRHRVRNAEQCDTMPTTSRKFHGEESIGPVPAQSPSPALLTTSRNFLAHCDAKGIFRHTSPSPHLSGHEAIRHAMRDERQRHQADVLDLDQCLDQCTCLHEKEDENPLPHTASSYSFSYGCANTSSSSCEATPRCGSPSPGSGCGDEDTDALYFSSSLSGPTSSASAMRAASPGHRLGPHHNRSEPARSRRPPPGSLPAPSLLTIRLSILACNPQPDPGAVEECVRLGADILYWSEEMERPILHELVKQDQVECVAACLRRARPPPRRGAANAQLDTASRLHTASGHTYSSTYRLTCSLRSSSPYFSGGRQQQQLEQQQRRAIHKVSPPSRGLDFTLQDDWGYSPLHHICAFKSNRETVERLLHLFLDRFERHQEDKVDWGQRNDHTEDFITVAAYWGLLSVVWPILKARGVPYYRYFGLSSDQIRKEKDYQERVKRFREALHEDIFAAPDKAMEKEMAAHVPLRAKPILIACRVHRSDWSKLSERERRYLIRLGKPHPKKDKDQNDETVRRSMGARESRTNSKWRGRERRRHSDREERIQDDTTEEVEDVD